MIDKFLEYIRIEKRYSENTIISYKRDLMDFLSFVMETEGVEDLSKIEKKVVRNFMVSLSENEISKRSINRKLSALRSFYLFLLKIGEIETSPMETIEALKFYAPKQIPFSVDEMNALKNLEIYNEPERFLEKLIIETLYQTGMRRSELCNLLYKDIDFSKNEIRVLGKGNKMRIIPISTDLMVLFQQYEATRFPANDGADFFFQNKKGKKMTEKFVYSVVNDYLGLVTFKQKKSPHMLRHSFATHILSEGAEISKVKTILGHSSLASTQVYTSADIEQLKKVFKNAHPRAKNK